MNQKTTPEQKLKIAEMRAKRFTNKQIAEVVGMHYKTVAKFAAALPLPPKFNESFAKPKTSGLSIKNAKAVYTSATKRIQVERLKSAEAPICAAAMEGRYDGGELKRMGSARFASR